MSVFVSGGIYYYDFWVEGRRYKKTTRKTTKQAAERVERDARQRIEAGYTEAIRQEERERSRQTISVASATFLTGYMAQHPSALADYKLKRVVERLGDRLISEITPNIVNQYQTDRLAAKAAPKTINDEVQLLLRLCGDQGDLIRAELRRKKSLKLKVAPSPGKPFSEEEQERMLAAALESTMLARHACDRQSHPETAPSGDKQGGSPSIYPALVVALNCGMRDAEIRRLRWSQLDFTKLILTVGKAKTDAGTGRTIPLNGTLLEALLDHAKWYVKRFGDKKPEWFVFPGGGRFPSNPAVGLTTLKTAWTAIRKKAKVDGRWHDARHTLITELAESGAGDETIMEIAGHVSQQMLKRYSHIRTAAKRKALEDVERARAAAKEIRVRAAIAQAEKDAAMRQEQVSNGVTETPLRRLITRTAQPGRQLSTNT